MALPVVASPGRRWWRMYGRPAVTLLLVAVALFGIWKSLAMSRDEKIPAIRDEAVRRVFPNEGTLHVRQDAIGIDLAPDYTGVILLDRVEIPEDQLQREPTANRVSWTPGVGDAPALQAGRHCATAIFWLTSESRERGRTYTWCFTAA